MAAPVDGFKYLAPVSRQGFGKFQTRIATQPAYEGVFYVQDYADKNSPKDELTQLGDISNDHFNASAHVPGGKTQTIPFIYVAQTSDQRGIIGYVMPAQGQAQGQGAYYLFTNYAYTSGQQFSTNTSPFDAATCFASGTVIGTTRGHVPVEELAVGDIVVTAFGRHRPIRWLGQRTIDLRHHPRAHEVQPICIAAHAFGFGMPARDLHLSPGHPVLVGADADAAGGHLVPIMCLVNGTSVERLAVDQVTYWHVELDAHDILLAEGLPAESYLDWGDRDFFIEGADHRLANPDFVVPGVAGRCRPVAVDGPIVEAERRRLDTVFAMRLSAACAWPSAGDLLPSG